MSISSFDALVDTKIWKNSKQKSLNILMEF